MNFLTDNTLKIYRELSQIKFLSEFTFVGGSAISSYLNHRLSEDLDFFTWMEMLPDTSTFIREVSKHHSVDIANLSTLQLDLFVDEFKITMYANNWEDLKNERHVLYESIKHLQPKFDITLPEIQKHFQKELQKII